MRIRIRFSKGGDLRFVGHRDLMESFRRILRRAEIRPAYSQGFHPKPKISFPAALPLCVIGENEVLEIELPEDQKDVCPETTLALLRKNSIPALNFLSAEVIPTGGKKAKIEAFTYAMAVPAERRENTYRRIEWVLAQRSIPFQRIGHDKVVDIMDSLISLSLLENGTLQFKLRFMDNGSGPRDILALLELGDLETHGSVLIRKNVHIG
ncbi:MAG: DUF2344 domain-containing protein [Planctomycetaceae bacterium]|nr:DUF2344 domain-containing protein [Planctomycetaceae bacterium]